VETLLKSLSDNRRLEIVRLVWDRELAAGEIADHFPDVTRPAISQHLGVLRRSGVICERRVGTRRLYRADHQEFIRLREFVDSFWKSRLEQLRDLAENAEITKEEQ
jgi:DNA-binding transcriptional ArsR family regulator